jgi:hypothetical protein
MRDLIGQTLGHYRIVQKKSVRAGWAICPVPGGGNSMTETETNSGPKGGLPDSFLTADQVPDDRYQIKTQLGRGGIGVSIFLQTIYGRVF